MEDLAGRVYGDGASVRPSSDEVFGALEPGATLVIADPSGTVVGWGGRVADDMVDTPVWASDVWALELSLPDEVKALGATTSQPLPQYPAAERDLALLVPDHVMSQAVSAVIRSSAGPQLEALELFDLYSGEGVPEDARSLAFRLRFRSPKRTLKDKEVDRSVKQVMQRLEEELGVKTR
jgi:phenylalanyl-tRNA synthetase beta chain